MSLPVPTEAQEAKILVAYLRIKGIRFTHIANETGRGRDAMMMGRRNKQMGTSPGFPDYIIIVNDNLLFCELKRTKGGVLSNHQKEWIEALEQAGQTVIVAKGAEQAIKFIETMTKGDI